MDDADKVLQSLQVQIKREIIDNYFADRVDLEDETTLLGQEVRAYGQDLDLMRRRFMALYQALGSEAACSLFMEGLGLKDWPSYQEFCTLPPQEQQDLLKDCRRRGFTAYRRFRNLIFDLYEQLHREAQNLREAYDKIQTHLRLLNEDIDKYNLSYDFGLIAAQIEALEGRGEVISGGLLAPEREELSTRMRFKHRQLTAAELPPLPPLPPLPEIRGRLTEVIGRIHETGPVEQ
jgi:hypothetical protein